MTLELPKEWQERALSAVDDLLNQKQLRERTKEIKQIIERLDLRWDNGFISKEEYLQKRAQFQQEMDGLHPLPRAMLEESLRVFRDFRKMWEEGDLYQRKHLLGLVVEKVWVKGTEISAITLRPSYHLVMTGLKKAVEDSGVLAEKNESAGTNGDGSTNEKTIQQVDKTARWLYGSDGFRFAMWYMVYRSQCFRFSYARQTWIRSWARTISIQVTCSFFVLAVIWDHNLRDACLLINKRISSTNFLANTIPCSASCFETKPATS